MNRDLAPASFYITPAAGSKYKADMVRFPVKDELLTGDKKGYSFYLPEKLIAEIDRASAIDGVAARGEYLALLASAALTLRAQQYILAMRDRPIRERMQRQIAEHEHAGERWTIASLCELLGLTKGAVQGHIDQMVCDGVLKPSASWVLTKTTDSKAA